MNMALMSDKKLCKRDRAMSTEALVSVLIPVYNCEKFIEKTLLSIINQSYKNLEIVIIDDCSTDNTFALVQAVRDNHPDVRFVLQQNQPNLGVSATRNRLVAAASGDYIAFLDSDDYLESNMIASLVNTLEKEQADVSQCLYFYESEDGSSKKVTNRFAPAGTLTGKQALIAMLEGDIPGFLWNKLFKRELFDGIAFDEKKIIFEDYEVLILIFNKNMTMSFTAEPLYHYIQRPQSLTKKSWDKATMRLDYLPLTDQLTGSVWKNKEERKIFLRHKYSVIARVAFMAVSRAVSFSAAVQAIKKCRSHLSFREFYSVSPTLNKKINILNVMLFTSPYTLVLLGRMGKHILKKG